ncbi:MAG: TRAP transporter small permease [Hoeflea sp.]|uniref:TRAP transporter small permease n=1 Tax=Hoeflea sp. TaxID=1940281 RepID=UPI002731B5CC|nr:TRAP transporter small permease [Hoeflea sp.]MDP2121920.1 TRAP transporter small permease [Hoeflea sp.]MDP3526255.1 TRAP transporter small permease [Hoeflea sp.]MDZ7600364.1 TRAP transporter small permease [Hoeflea sp.]
MERGVAYLIRTLEFILVALLAGMAIMVFSNVVLRYGFNSGLNISEEVSRYFFVWLTFIGAVLTFRENSHLGVETMVRLFGRRGRLVCMLLSNALILFCSAVLFWGTWKQMPINASMIAPVTGMPMIYIFGISFFTSVGIGLIALMRIVSVLTGTTTDAEIARFAGEYDHGTAEGRGE